jgi:D-threo-aldose 1-dehydrogenase
VHTNRLGRTAVEVTALGFGGGPLGGMYRPLDDATAAETMDAAWSGGIRFFDTAPHYGIGHSERRFGMALREHPRDEFTLSTKVGRLLIPQEPQGQKDEAFEVPASYRRVWDWSRDGVRRSLEESLERIGIDHADIVLLHDPEFHWEQALRDAYPVLAELRHSGVIGAIGAGMNRPDLLTQLVRETDVDVVMTAGRYTLLNQEALDDLLPACMERGVSVLAAAPFNSGVLSSARPADDARFEYAVAPPGVIERARRIADVCEQFGVTLPQAALQFALRHPAVASVVVGMDSPEQVRSNVAALEAAIPDGLWAALIDQKLLDERVPPRKST